MDNTYTMDWERIDDALDSDHCDCDECRNAQCVPTLAQMTVPRELPYCDCEMCRAVHLANTIRQSGAIA